MKDGSRAIYRILLLVFCTIWAGCRPQVESAGTHPLHDDPLLTYQQDLLQTAFAIASAIPVHPHIKDRSLAQQQVVSTCIALKQAKLALQYSNRIDNWRKGLCLARLAEHSARQGWTHQANALIEQADKIAETAEDWRRDRIYGLIARIHLLLGQSDQAAVASRDLEDSESSNGIDRMQAELCPDDAFQEQVDGLDRLIATGEYEKTSNALHIYVKLLARFYENRQRRALILEKIPASWEKIPYFVRIELLMDCIDIALEHADMDQARQFLGQAYGFMEVDQWRPENRLPLLAKLIKLRFRIGQMQEARADADAALALFAEQRPRIVDIYQAETLYPLAEAYSVMGDKAKALEVYGQAIEAGIQNPNSRPRAEDVSAICCSMAVNDLEPSPELQRRIEEIQQGLGDPW